MRLSKESELVSLMAEEKLIQRRMRGKRDIRKSRIVWGHMTK